MASKYKWIGPAGSSPVLGAVHPGKEFLKNKKIGPATYKELIDQGLLEEAKTKPKKEGA